MLRVENVAGFYAKYSVNMQVNAFSGQIQESGSNY